MMVLEGDNVTFSVKFLTTQSILTSAAVMLEVLGGLFPGVGTMLEGFSTLFIALAGIISPAGGLMTFTATAALLGILMPIQLPVFLLFRGLAGLILGITMRYGRKWAIFLSSLSLTLGVYILSTLLGFPVLGPAFGNVTGALLFMVVFLYCLLFSWLWTILINRVTRRISRLIPHI